MRIASERSSSPPRKKNRRAFALILVLFLVLVMSILGFAATYIATLDARGTVTEMNAAAALYAATAGLNKARACLTAQPTTWTGLTTPQTYGFAGTTWSANPSASTSPQFTVSATYYPATQWYWITSTGSTYIGSTQLSSRTVNAWVGPQCFSQYAMFTGAETTVSGSEVYFTSHDMLTGACHTNGYYNFLGHPQFSSTITSSNQGDSDYTASTGSTQATYNQGGTRTTDIALFYNYYTNYSTDGPTAETGYNTFYFAGAQPSVSMDTAGSSVIKSTAGQTIKPSGGGNVTLTFNSAGTVTVAQPSGTTTTTLTGPTTIYVDPGSGHSTSISGTVVGNVTIGTPQEVDITNNLVYSSATKTSSSLGLLSDNYIYVNTSATNVEVDAAIMTPFYAFGVKNYDTISARGTLTLYGGITEKYRGAVGTAYSDGTIASGYAKNYTYDAKLVDVPPPNFPTNSKMLIKSYQDNNSLH